MIADLFGEERKPRKSVGAHESHQADTVVWLTPLHIIEALGPFDLDPCGVANWPTATRKHILPTDGLRAPWEGRVWLNPPYGAEAWKWLHRLAEHGTGTALIFARTETAGFRQQVWLRASAILFLHGRLSFHLPDGRQARANAGAPSCLVAYGPDDAHRLRTSGLTGTYVSEMEAVA